MSARWITADVFDGLAQLEDGSVDLVVTSPPFLALRSYLPADHPDKSKEIGSEATPAEFIDVMLKVTAELRRVLAPHGSICIELGDTYAGSGSGGLTESELTAAEDEDRKWRRHDGRTEWEQQHPIAFGNGRAGGGPGWPLAKSRTLIPQLYEIALAYGINPLTGTESPAGRWRVRNIVTWARPNPPVGALGDKWRPATSDVVVACVSGKRYWDDLATRRPHQNDRDKRPIQVTTNHGGNKDSRNDHGEVFYNAGNSSGAPLLDYWEIPPGGYKGAHYAVFPSALVEPLVKAMCPQKVCRECGEPSRRIVETSYESLEDPVKNNAEPRVVADVASGRQIGHYDPNPAGMKFGRANKISETTGWTDCGHDNYRPGRVLDPFAGSGTTLAVATGHGHDAIGIDLDPRNEELARERVGPFFFEVRAVVSGEGE